MRVTYRQIAKILVRGLPLNDNEIASKIEEYTRAIEAMPEQARFALQSAYIFSSKVPPKEREDFFQELVCAVLEMNTKDEAYGYMKARGIWLDRVEGFAQREGSHKKKHHKVSSLNEVIVLDNQEVELGDRIIGADDLEDKVIERIEAQRIYRELPRHIKLIVKKRFRGEPLSKREKQQLFKCRQELRCKYPDYQYRAVAHSRAK